ncbi:MAG: DUF302 domain-containing protein [Kofleriaceae bacterium]
MTTTLGMPVHTALTFDQALVRVPEALKAEGFGILTEVDVAATLKTKLDVDFRRYRILGACNPTLAHRALTTNLGAGTMMPCSVAVYEADDGNATVVAIDPSQTAAAGSPELVAIMGEVKERLGRVIAALS